MACERRKEKGDREKVEGGDAETGDSQREKRWKDSGLISCPPSWRELFRGTFIVDFSSASIGVHFYSVFTDSRMMNVDGE